jgi:EmrB/QacA subfamily drug resistance transporter
MTTLRTPRRTSRPDAGGQERFPARRRQRTLMALAALALVQFVLVLDSAIVNVALATIGREFGTPPHQLTWVVNAYALSFGGLLLLGGRLADVAGRRRLFLLGTALFGLASLAGAAAPSTAWLILARAVQGAGAAMAAPAALALLVTLFPSDHQRGKALGLFGVMAGAGGSAGLLLGGALTQALGWRSVLWINVPVVLAVLAATRLLPTGERSGPRPSLDVPGAVTATAGVGLLVFAVVEAPAAGWSAPRTLGAVAVAVLMLLAFVRVEATAPVPLVARSVARSTGLRVANVAAALMMGAMFPMWFLLTLYLQQGLGHTPVGAGLAVLPLSLTMMAANSLAPRALARWGTRTAMTAGLVAAGGGLAWLAATVAGHGDSVQLLLPSIVTGLGFGLAFVAGVVAATVPAPAADAGVASGLVNTSQQVGGALGLAALLSLVAAMAPDTAGTTTAFTVALLAAAGIALVGAGVALAGLDRRRMSA